MISKPAPTYRLATIADLLKVPAARREACVRCLLYALAAREIAFGSDVLPDGDQFTWIDDGDMSVSLRDAGGEEIAALKIEKNDTL